MLGIIANPAAGKDVRRLVANASVVTNEVKAGIIARVLVGAAAAGETVVHYLGDPRGLVERAAVMAGRPVELVRIEGAPGTAWTDTAAAATALRHAGAGAVVTLGGDGTNRAAVIGWPDLPVLPLAAGTNNAFPRTLDGTVAGLAAGLVSSGKVALTDAAVRRPVVRASIGDRQCSDVAVVDAVVLRPGPVGARALYDEAALRMAVVAGPDAAVTGLAGMAAVCCPDASTSDAVLLEFGDPEPSAGGAVRTAVLAPGLVVSVAVRSARRMAPGERVAVEGPCLLAFDGERERALPDGGGATLSVDPDGPWVIDAGRTLLAGARAGWLDRDVMVGGAVGGD